MCSFLVSVRNMGGVVECFSSVRRHQSKYRDASSKFGEGGGGSGYCHVDSQSCYIASSHGVK